MLAKTDQDSSFNQVCIDRFVFIPLVRKMLFTFVKGFIVSVRKLALLLECIEIRKSAVFTQFPAHLRVF